MASIDFCNHHCRPCAQHEPQILSQCCLLQVGSIVNFSLMYLLASLPATSAAAQSGGLVQKIFSEQTLRAWGAPAGHMFQPGFPFSARVVNLAYKASLPGTALCMVPLQTCSRT